MKLFLLSKNAGYDEYAGLVVVAKNELDAVGVAIDFNNDFNCKSLDCELIGTAKRGSRRGVVLDSFIGA